MLLGDLGASDDALYGAGRGDLDRGRRRAGALPRSGRRATISKARSRATRRTASRAPRVIQAISERQHLDAGRRRRYQLALRLRRLERRSRHEPASNPEDQQGGVRRTCTTDWGRAVDLYCERTDPSFWAEPFNAVTNASFLIAALVALVQWRRGGNDWPVLALIAVTFAIGIGSFVFHTVATSGATSSTPSRSPCSSTATCCWRCGAISGCRSSMSIAILVAFSAFNYAEAALVPVGALNGSHAYLPALCRAAYRGLAGSRQQGRPIDVCRRRHLGGVADVPQHRHGCSVALPLGTHFIWHSFGTGLALYLLMRALRRPKDLRPTVAARRCRHSLRAWCARRPPCRVVRR